jgi:hypothetical protein
MDTMPEQPAKQFARRRLTKAALYRACRDWHGYLSAFAFLMLIFFSLTGLLLNHPEWTDSLAAKTKETVIVLAASELEAVSASDDPVAAATSVLIDHVEILGRFSSGEVFDGEAFLRFDGPRGSTDAVINLETGHAELTHRAAPVAVILNNLHRGKNAGPVWQSVIDVSAALILALSLIGYVLFFTLRFRLRSGLMLTAVSAAVILGAYLIFVP